MSSRVLRTSAGSLASASSLMTMKKLGPADTGIDAGQVGTAGRKVELKRLYVPEKTAEAEILEGDVATATASLVDRLQKEAKVL